jgi:hypothetical protein
VLERVRRLMPTTIERSGSYARPFSVVSAALWDKYEGHRHVTNVETLSTAIDAQGRLHRRRVLTMEGKLPMVLRPLLGAKPLYLLEEVVVDVQTEQMAVRTTNINFRNVLCSSSYSTYTPASPQATAYAIHVKNHAFPSPQQQASPLSDLCLPPTPPPTPATPPCISSTSQSHTPATSAETHAPAKQNQQFPKLDTRPSGMEGYGLCV